VYATVVVRVEHAKYTMDVEDRVKALGYSAFSINDLLARAKTAFILLDIVLGLIGSIALVVSSHLLPDVESTCEHVVVLDKGNVVAQGPISTLKGKAGRVFELRVKGGDERHFADVLRAEGIECHGELGEVMRVFVPEDAGSRRLFQLAAQHGMQVRHLRPSVPTLEDVFAHAVGEDL